MDTWMIIGLGLALYFLCYCLTAGRDEGSGRRSRASSGVQAGGTVSSGTARRDQRSFFPPPLPSRRTRTRRAGRIPGRTPGPGPRGIQTRQFPCCPICHQRNDGGVQKVFWNSRKKLYRCSRGHEFQQNGKLFLS